MAIFSRNTNIVRVCIPGMADDTSFAERRHKKPDPTGQDNREKGSPAEIPFMGSFLAAFGAIDEFHHEEIPIIFPRA